MAERIFIDHPFAVAGNIPCASVDLPFGGTSTHITSAYKRHVLADWAAALQQIHQWEPLETRLMLKCCASKCVLVYSACQLF